MPQSGGQELCREQDLGAFMQWGEIFEAVGSGALLACPTRVRALPLRGLLGDGSATAHA